MQMVALCPDNMIGRRDRRCWCWASPARSDGVNSARCRFDDLAEDLGWGNGAGLWLFVGERAAPFLPRRDGVKPSWPREDPYTTLAAELPPSVRDYRVGRCTGGLD